MADRVLAQIDPTAAVAQGLSGGNAQALAWGLAISLAVIAYLYKQISDLRREHAVELAAKSKELADQLRADAKEQREILSQIVPLAAKLVDALEAVERLTDQLTVSDEVNE